MPRLEDPIVDNIASLKAKFKWEDGPKLPTPKFSLQNDQAHYGSVGKELDALVSRYKEFHNGKIYIFR